jgi:hypothetical protein
VHRSSVCILATYAEPGQPSFFAKPFGSSDGEFLVDLNCVNDFTSGPVDGKLDELSAVEIGILMPAKAPAFSRHLSVESKEKSIRRRLRQTLAVILVRFAR